MGLSPDVSRRQIHQRRSTRATPAQGGRVGDTKQLRKNDREGIMTDEEMTQLAINTNWDENIWGVGAAERASEKVRLRAGPGGDDRKGFVR